MPLRYFDGYAVAFFNELSHDIAIMVAYPIADDVAFRSSLLYKNCNFEHLG